jgi:rhamnose transport system permease protein
VSIFGGRGSIVGVVLAIAVFAGLQSALLLTNFEQRAMGVVTGTLLLLSVLIPNGSMFVRRARDVLRRRELRGATPALNAKKAS